MIPAIIQFIVWLLVIGVLYILLDWLIKTLPVPDPAGRIIRVVVVVVFCIVLIVMLLQLVGISTGVDLPKLG